MTQRKKKLMAVFAILSLSFALVSCGDVTADDFTSVRNDDSSLKISSYPRIQMNSGDGEIKDYVIYYDFLTAEEAKSLDESMNSSGVSMNYQNDGYVNLNSSKAEVIQSGSKSALGDYPRSFDLTSYCEAVTKTPLKYLLSHGGRVDIFSSMGEMPQDDASKWTSLRYSITELGYLYSFSVIASKDQSMSVNKQKISIKYIDWNSFWAGVKKFFLG